MICKAGDEIVVYIHHKRCYFEYPAQGRQIVGSDQFSRYLAMRKVILFQVDEVKSMTAAAAAAAAKINVWRRI